MQHVKNIRADTSGLTYNPPKWRHQFHLDATKSEVYGEAFMEASTNFKMQYTMEGLRWKMSCMFLWGSLEKKIRMSRLSSNPSHSVHHQECNFAMKRCELGLIHDRAAARLAAMQQAEEAPISNEAVMSVPETTLQAFAGLLSEGNGPEWEVPLTVTEATAKGEALIDTSGNSFSIKDKFTSMGCPQLLASGHSFS